jgi:uncharacterized repeat protein (TIGR03803 family)
MKMRIKNRLLLPILTTALVLLLGTGLGATFTTLHSFGVGEGEEPNGLVLGNDGNFYGTTIGGGAGMAEWLGCGSIFRITPDGTFTTLYSFSGPDGATPGLYWGVDYYCISPGLIQGSDNNLYGITGYGGIGFSGDPYNLGWQFNDSGYGTVFRMALDGTLTTLVFFDGTNGAIPSSILQGQDGNFYGTTMGARVASGSPIENGTVFKMTADGTITTLAVFNDTNGSNPRSLIQAKDATFYGTTDFGGANGKGTVFKVTPDGTLTTLASFNTNASAPYSIMQASDGNFYGTMNEGGKMVILSCPSCSAGYLVYYLGTVFRMSPGGTLTNIVLFTQMREGGGPVAGLLEGTDGNLYGSTYVGGPGTSYLPSGPGLLFKTTPDGSLTTLFQFRSNSLDGVNPRGNLVQASDGSFYGTTSWAGPGFATNGSFGTVFRLTVPGAEAPKIIRTTLTGGTMTIAWLALAGRSYQLQLATDLMQTNWSNAGSVIIATNTVMSTSDSAGMNSQRFYRVALVP